MSWFKDQLRAMHTLIDGGAGETITVRRGVESIEITGAVRGRSDFDNSASDGETRVEIKSVDWIIDPHQYIFGGKQVEPINADQIIAADGEKYDTMPGLQGNRWRWSDSRKTRYRIHTLRRSK